jgi:uncharacterized membrane protein
VPSGTAAGPYDVAVTAAPAGGAAPPPAIVRNATVNVTGGGSARILAGPGTPDPVDVRAAPGVVTFTNIVTNTGNAAVPISVPASFTAPAGWTATTTATTCNAVVSPGATCSFTVEVSVPLDADAGSYDITVSATADNSGQPAPAPENVTATAVNRVNVLRVRGVALAPDRTLEGGPGDLLTFTHTLTNTGNGADSFTLGFVAASPGWTVTLTPTAALNVPRGGTRPVTVTAVVPAGLLAGSTNTITVTATAQGGPESAAVVDTAQVAALTAADLSPGRRQNLDAGETVTYTHTITNTGTTLTAFSVEAQDSGAGWSSALTGSPTAPLAPGETVTVTLAVTAPLAATPGVSNTTVLRLFEEGSSAPLLDQEQDVTTVGPALGVLITPDNVGFALPESTTFFTHTVTNIGTTQGIFSLTAAESNGWSTSVTPAQLNLGAGQSAEVTVGVTLPDGPAAGAPGFARVTVQLEGDPTVSDDATNTITVARVIGVDLSASQVRAVTPGRPVPGLSSLTLYNRGNADDTFDLLATGVPAGWTITLTPSAATVQKDSTFSVSVSVNVPANVLPGTIRTIVVEARSRTDTSVRDSVELTLVYAPAAPPRPLYLPLIAR